MIRNKYLLSLAVVLLLAIWPNTGRKASAQSSGATAASITGRIGDEQGAQLSQAIITLRNLQTKLVRQTTTDQDGTYFMPQLPPGDYELGITAAGFATAVSKVTLVLGSTLVFNSQLVVGQTNDVVEVTASSISNYGITESSSNNLRQRIDNLPINRRNFLDFSLTSARVTPDRFPGQGVAATSGLSFNGQPARFNNINLDGVSNNEGFSGGVLSTISQEAVQEFQIVSDSYSAEFGRALGGIVNIVTRGGTNEFHSTIFNFFRNDKISARDVFATSRPPFRQYQFGATLSGPIKPEKAFFFTAFERTSIKQSRFVTISDAVVASARNVGFGLNNGPVPFALGVTTLLARGDVKISANDQLYVRYNGGFSFNGALEPFGGLIGQTNGGTENLRDNFLAVSNNYVGRNLVNETRFTYGRRRQLVAPIDLDGPQIQLFANEGLVTFGRRTLLPQPRRQQNFQFVNNLAWQQGRQQIKLGVDFAYNDLSEASVPITGGGIGIFTPINFASALNLPGAPLLSALESFDPTLRTPTQRLFLRSLALELPRRFDGFPLLALENLSLPSTYLQGFGDATSPITSKFLSLFVQDDIKVRSNLLIKLGLRYDLNRVTTFPRTNGNFSPRMAFSYNLNERLNLHGAYGIFVNVPLIGASTVVQTTGTGKFKVPVIPFPFSTIPFSLPGRRLPSGDTIPPGVDFIPQLSLMFQFEPRLRNSYSQQANFGIDYRLDNDTVASVSYTYIRGLKLFSVNSINPIVRPVPGDILTSAITGRVDPTRGDVFLYTSAFDSYYNAFTVSLTRKASKRIGLTASYTFSKSIDNFQDVLRNELEANNPLDLRGERGLSLQDVRNRLLVSGTWELNYTRNRWLRGFQLAAILDLESGRPFNLVAGSDVNMDGDNPPGDRPLGIGRNAGVTPGFANLDLRVTRQLRLNERVTVNLIAETFNTFNRVNISEINRVFAPNAQGQFQLPEKENGRFISTRDRFRNAFSPRQFQLGLRLVF
jgi:hypothetical protein